MTSLLLAAAICFGIGIAEADKEGAIVRTHAAGALKALIIANEFLERDLEMALACHHAPSIAHDGDGRFSVLANVEEEEEIELHQKT
jgi:hypothetical protein